jgi:hypothetical protein
MFWHSEESEEGLLEVVLHCSISDEESDEGSCCTVGETSTVALLQGVLHCGVLDEGGGVLINTSSSLSISSNNPSIMPEKASLGYQIRFKLKETVKHKAKSALS